MLVTFFTRKSYLLWDNVEECSTTRLATDYNLIRRMRIACWIPKATDKHSKPIILTVFPFNSGKADAPQCHVYTYIASLIEVKIVFVLLHITNIHDKNSSILGYDSVPMVVCLFIDAV
jgi:hypothetical protein